MAEPQKTVYLWTLSRSVSTAVLRSMSTVSSCKAIFEPYIVPFFKETKSGVHSLPISFGHTFSEVRHNLQSATFTGHNCVFIKEMPCHMCDHETDTDYIPEGATHSFLIRHPVKTINSMIRGVSKLLDILYTDEAERSQAAAEWMTLEGMRLEQSYKPIHTVFKTVTQTYKQKPVVIDADDLQANPEGTLRAYCEAVGMQYQDSMVHWGPITPEQREVYSSILSNSGWESIIHEAVNGVKFESREPQVVGVKDVEETYRGLVEENLPLYQALRAHRLQPHQV